MTYIHNINPVALEIFGVKIYWYSLAYLFGFYLSLIYSKFLIKNYNLLIEHKEIENFLSYAILGVILGGRIGYVLFYNFNFYFRNPIEIFKIWNGGMSFHGGMIGLIIAMLIFTNVKKINFFLFANIISACAPIGIFLGRIANFINGELYGKPSEMSWGVIFDVNEMIPRHPTQLYEAFTEGLLLFFILLLSFSNKFYKSYNPCCIFMIFYSVFRFLIEFIRLPDEQIGYLVLNLSMGQILCFPMLFCGLFFIKKNGRKNI